MVTALAFMLDGERYAIPIAAVAEILPFMPLKPAPGAAASVKGILALRGYLIPVVDAAERLGVTRRSALPADPKIIAGHGRGGDNRYLGFLVDDVLDLIEFDESAVSRLSDGDRLELKVVEVNGEFYRLIDPEKFTGSVAVEPPADVAAAV